MIIVHFPYFLYGYMAHSLLILEALDKLYSDQIKLRISIGHFNAYAKRRIRNIGNYLTVIIKKNPLPWKI